MDGCTTGLAQGRCSSYDDAVDSWRPDSWQERQALHQPSYSDAQAYRAILNEIRDKPPIVFAGEVDQLKRQIALAGEGESFVLQGGDCVERFADCRADVIENKLRILLQMSVILTHAAREPVVRLGRMAGQFVKPRSQDTETIDGRPTILRPAWRHELRTLIGCARPTTMPWPH